MLGIIAGICASITWTYACFIWRSQAIYFSALQINFLKNILAALIFSPILLIAKLDSSFNSIGLLFLSGIIGIAFGDTFYIAALQRLGTRTTLTIEAFSPVLATLIGVLFLDETLAIKSWIGILIVTISLIFVVRQRKTGADHGRNKSLFLDIGLVYATASILCATIAAALSRLVLLNTSLSAFQTTEIRLIGAVIALLPLARAGSLSLLASLRSKNIFKLFFATLLGTNLGILLQQIVFRNLPLGIGWTLLSTSTLVSLFFARFEGEEINKVSIILGLTTFLGVAIVFI